MSNTGSPADAAIRSEFVQKLKNHSSEIELAAQLNKDNPHFQALERERRYVFTQNNTSMTDVETIKAYSAMVDSIAATFKQMRQSTPTPSAAPVPKPPTPAPKSTPPPASSSGSTDNLLGLDLEDVLGDVLSDEGSISEAFSESTDDIFRVDGDKIVLQIDEELETAIDEEAKMFEVEQYYRNKEYFKALTVALALNIRFKQGIGRRSDAIVRRQDEIIFESNYRIVHENLEKIKSSKGDEKVNAQLSAIMHIYAALDQQALASQEKYRNDMRNVLDKLVQSDGGYGAKGYIKTGLFSKVEVPGQEDKAAKSFYWKDRASKEKDAVRKEFYLLMMFSSDLNYYPYQIALANFYLENSRLDEACRYIKVALPLVEAEGVEFLLNLKKKDGTYAEKFIERRFAADMGQLRNRFDRPEEKEVKEKDDKKREFMVKDRQRKLLQTIDLWQKRLDAMKSDVPFRKSTLRLEYTKGILEVVNKDILSKVPNLIVEDYITRYKGTDVRSTQNPNILNFIDFSYRYSVTPEDKTAQGLVVEGEAEAKLESLCKSVVDYFNVEIGVSNKPLAEVKAKLEGDNEQLVKAMKSQGYKFEKVPSLTRR
ncbi:MAG: hypothetical protein SFU91_01630 [Chloroherpetonaceae bacterium]|nr:hypothetical protein [Chloroherpetonaceae bacterium]